MGREILYSEVNFYYDEVMDYSYILHSAVPLVDKFQTFGFEKAGDEYLCKKNSHFCIIQQRRHNCPICCLLPEGVEKGSGVHRIYC